MRSRLPRGSYHRVEAMAMRVLDKETLIAGFRLSRCSSIAKGDARGSDAY